jgi:hypothetical protein
MHLFLFAIRCPVRSFLHSAMIRYSTQRSGDYNGIYKRFLSIGKKAGIKREYSFCLFGVYYNQMKL